MEYTVMDNYNHEMANLAPQHVLSAIKLDKGLMVTMVKWGAIWVT